MGAYYNEIDPFAAAWLRELIKAGLIADGEVDERSIEEVQPEDVRGFTQCHFFAGIGVWSYALRAAGWSDDLAVWSGSCPCQSFSQSGKGEGFSDKRHLWPAWFRLIRECRPEAIFGEQVASKDGRAWYDVVSADMEGAGYAIGEANLGAHSVGAPHIRQRLFFVADSGSRTSQRNARSVLGAQAQGRSERLVDGNLFIGHRDGGTTEQLAHAEYAGLNRPRTDETITSSNGQTDGLFERSDSGLRSPVADTTGRRCEQRNEGERSIQLIDENGAPVNVGDSGESRQQGRLHRGTNSRREVEHGHTGRSSTTGELDNAARDGRESGPELHGEHDGQVADNGRIVGPTNGFWRDAEWIYCRDQKWRPVKSGLPVLVNGTPNRVGRLRGFGNAINAEVAKAFIEAYLESVGRD